MQTIPVDSTSFAAVLDMARAHVDEIESGIEDGTYDASENEDLPKKREVIENLDLLYRETVVPDTKEPELPAPEDSADEEVKVRTVQSGSEWVSWNISQNLTDRWGDINFYNEAAKPLAPLLDESTGLLERLRAQMTDETTFVVRKDGQYGLLFEVEFCSIESEFEVKDDDSAWYATLERQAKVEARILAAFKELQGIFPGVEFCVPDPKQIYSDRPAAWAFVKDGQLDQAQRLQLAALMHQI